MSDIPAKSVPRRLLDYNQAGLYMSLSRDSLTRMVTDGVIPHVRWGRKILIDIDDLNEWIEANKETGC